MLEEIKKKYIVDENNKKVAVQIDIDTFNKMEKINEDYGLYKLIRESENDEKLSVEEAKAKLYPNKAEIESKDSSIIEPPDYSTAYDEKYLKQLRKKAKNWLQKIEPDEWLNNIRGVDA
jgi:hypothetical protein